MQLKPLWRTTALSCRSFLQIRAMAPRGKRMSRKAPPPAAMVLANDTFASAKMLVTLLEKEAAAGPLSKKSKRHTSKKAGIAKILNDHFRALSREDK